MMCDITEGIAPRLDAYPYYPENIEDDPTHPAYARYQWDASVYKSLGFKTILNYLSALNMIAARQSWVRLASTGKDV